MPAAAEQSPAVASHGRTRPADFALLALAAGVTVLVSFLLWEFAERRLAVDVVTAYQMHYARGVSTSLMTAGVVAFVSYFQHRRWQLLLEQEVERRTAEANEARSFLEVVFQATPASLLVLDNDMNVIRANRAATQLHGIEPSGTCYELTGGHEICEGCPAVDMLQRGGMKAVLGEHRDPRTGELLAVEGHRLELPGGESRLLLVEQRMTEQKKLEARLLHQEKMAAFGLLAAGIAHDMGNPLSSIGAQLQLLDGDELSAEARPVIDTVRQETQRLRRILRELVDFARRRRDEASLVSVQAVVKDALRLVRHDPRARKTVIKQDFDPEAAPVFMVEDHLMQVVLNLLINALDAMPDGGTLRVEVRAAGERVALRIHDTGHGIERSVLARCFEPMFTTKPPRKGTGLGLSICKDIIDGTGGTIEIHSAPGQGTTVVAILPAADENTTHEARERLDGTQVAPEATAG